MRVLISRLRDGLRFAGTLNFSKLQNYFIVRFSFMISRMLGKAIHKGMPVSLSIEPTTSCNLHCPECPSGLRQFTRPVGKIDPVLFKETIDQLKDSLIYLMLYFQGEPLLHPHFFDLVRYAKDKHIYTATSTNGHFLDKEHAEKAIRSGLDRIIISLDATDQETYEKYRRGGEMQKVTDGIRTLVRKKKDLGSTYPFIILQFIVFKFNEHQIPDIKRLARELKVDRLEVKTAQVYDYSEDREMIPDNSKYNRYVKGSDGWWKLRKPIRNRCYRMWSGAVITWDGRVAPCCFDKDAVHQMGKTGAEPFLKIWRSQKYQEFRQQILSDRRQIDICRNCSE